MLENSLIPSNNKKMFFKQVLNFEIKKILITLIILFSGVLYSQYAAALVVSRGPYLQTETPRSIIVRYRTDTPTDSVVRYGTTISQLNATASVAGSKTEHTVLISGLTADTRYYYSVGNSVGVLEGGTANYSFTTAPVPGTAKPTRIWVIGDSGTANSNARAVRDAYKTYTGSQPTDLWLMLGDNAYNSGTDSEYQDAVFSTYPELLQQVAVWPVLGNHDGRSADSLTGTGPFYDIFNLPIAGEAGGIPSGTEAYYSFDYGNIHFIAMDSFETDRSVGGTMLTWLENDLLANDKPWIIAFWHHPPYTKGSHDSDSEDRLIEMRQNALPILESHGVDLVLSGHSHSYERSMLIDGHYGSSNTLTSAMILNAGSGRSDTADGTYSKTGGVAIANEGAVYAVAGSSGLKTGGNLNHPAMYISLNLLGSMVIDVNGNQLDARFLDSTGVVQDYFSLLKGADTTCSASVLNLPSDQWRQISLPCALPNNAQTVKAVFADDLNGIYGTDWVIFSFDPIANTYVDVGLNGILTQGLGYWVIHSNGSVAIVDLPTGSTQTVTTPSSQCVSITGCYSIPLIAKTDSVQWNMSGYPFSKNVVVNRWRVVTNSGACLNGCTLDQAKANNIIDNQAWHFNGETYVELQGNVSVNPWSGFWIGALEGSDALKPTLVIPVD